MKILILQKRALRMVYFADRRDHAIPFFVDANILPTSMFQPREVFQLNT